MITLIIPFVHSIVVADESLVDVIEAGSLLQSALQPRFTECKEEVGVAY